jgi:hypothetical protein
MKRGMVVVLAVVILFCSRAYAVSGISPGTYSLDFVSNQKIELPFEIIGDEGAQYKIVAEGDLASYVSFNKKVLNGPGKVTATLSFPEDIPSPGQHTIFVSAMQQATGKGGISLLAVVKGMINVRVPYPDEYISASITATSANAGKPVNLVVSVSNLGKKDISTRTSVVIYDSSNRSIANIPFGKRDIESLKSTEFESQLNTEGYLPGLYRAEAIVEYSNKKTKAETSFRLGELFVNITGYSNDFLRDRLNKIDIEVESFWGEPIEKIYASVFIVNYSINFQTTPADIMGFQKTTLTGYFDTTGILEDEFFANMTLHYQGKTSEKIALLWFKKENKTPYFTYGIIALAILVIILVIVLIVWKKLRGENERFGKKKKRRR